jgi:hypothetical protein
VLTDPADLLIACGLFAILVALASYAWNTR